MKPIRLSAVAVFLLLPGTPWRADASDAVAPLPDGVDVVWDLDAAHRESTRTRQRICINGLWRWQPASQHADDIPESDWGHFKVPGCWPGITNYMQKDCQTLFAHPTWKDHRLIAINAAWYQRQITVPRQWAGRRIVLRAEHVNSLAEVFVDETRIGQIHFPGGEIDLTSVCQPGQQHMLSIRVEALPLKAVMLSYSDTASARQVKGQVARRGLCGDLYLASTPLGPRIDDVKVETSVRSGSITVDADLTDLDNDATYLLRAHVIDAAGASRQFDSQAFRASQLEDGRIRFSRDWLPDQLWDVHTPQNMCRLRLSLLDRDAEVVDTAHTVPFGFREFWIDGRDFYLNGTRIYLSSVPLDNAQVGAAWATYEAARESLERLASFGINFVYTHNYGCEPGTHLSFDEILRAADDVGMLVGFSQPHFGHYDWDGPDADRSNGYARHAEYYVRVAQNHPSVVAYSTSHNATGYADDMNPRMIDGIQHGRTQWSQRNADRALRAQTIIRKFDPSRIVYHHAGGNLGAMHTSNFYANFVPIQEMTDWFGHWSTNGVKPLFTCEYSVPFPWDWTMYRGWYNGERAFGSAAVPWEFCMSQWNAQFMGDRAYRISDEEKRNLRWEARQFEDERVWHRWDYPHQVGSSDFAERYPIYAMYFADNWPAFRTWGVSALSPWNHGHHWTLREGVDRSRKELDVDWQQLQRPGFSPDYVDERYERMDLAYERDDWIPTVAGQTLIRNNRPLLAYIAGKRESFTCKDHNFDPGETVSKQLIVINNSRGRVTADCSWKISPGPFADAGGSETIQVEPGGQFRIPCRFELPANLNPGRYKIESVVNFAGGETMRDSFAIDVLPRPTPRDLPTSIALFDPEGQTDALLASTGVRYTKVDANVDVGQYDLLIIGRRALTTDGPAPNLAAVRDGGKVLVLEQTAEVLEQRLGFRVAEYGLRRVFRRVSDHPALAGLEEQHLRNWRGEATLTPPHSDLESDPRYSGAPSDRWCGIPISRIWRSGNRGNVASVLIEKPARGDFLPIVDGGYDLQYSPLMEYREGSGMVLFCQMDVTGRTEGDPASEILLFNLLDHLAGWRPTPQRQAVYAGDREGRRALDKLITTTPFDGQSLSEDDVLIVTSADAAVSDRSDEVANWIRSGGHVLALGLDQREASAILPSPIRMDEDEHIATWFKPFSVESLLAGVSPAEVHIAAPRKLSLLTADAAIGNGVLGSLDDTHVVFSQLDPAMWKGPSSPPDRRSKPGTVSPHLNLKRAHRRVSRLTSRLLANMGVAVSTPILDRFSAPVESTADETEGRWLEGLYVDTPEEWDYPYRFFRW